MEQVGDKTYRADKEDPPAESDRRDGMISVVVVF
jgi:hypothetical protein